MKRTLSVAVVVSALVGASPVFAQSAYGAKSRAQVKAELTSARRAGDLDAVSQLSYPQLRPYQERHAEAQARTGARAGNGAQ